MKILYECVCKNCSTLFEHEDEEAILCPQCWRNFLERQINKPTYQLTEDFLKNFEVKDLNFSLENDIINIES